MQGTLSSIEEILSISKIFESPKIDIFIVFVLDINRVFFWVVADFQANTNKRRGISRSNVNIAPALLNYPTLVLRALFSETSSDVVDFLPHR